MLQFRPQAKLSEVEVRRAGGRDPQAMVAESIHRGFKMRLTPPDPEEHHANRKKKLPPNLLSHEMWLYRYYYMRKYSESTLVWARAVMSRSTFILLLLNLSASLAKRLSKVEDSRRMWVLV